MRRSTAQTQEMLQFGAGLDRQMSQRGYGDPPYPPTNSGARQRGGSGPGRDLSGAYDRDPGPIRTDTRNPGPSEYGRPYGGGRRGETEEPRYEPQPSRSSRSRWSNPPPRRRRHNQTNRAVDYPQPDPGPAYQDDFPPAYDDPYTTGSSEEGWDEFAESSEWDEIRERPPRRPRGSRLGGQVRTPRLRLGGAPKSRSARSPRTGATAVRIPNLIARVELLHDHVAVALLGVTLVSALLMGAILAGRLGNLPDVLTLRYDASGSATRWGTAESLWELPLLAGMVSIINIVVAWWLSGIDRFASRFVLATAFLVSLLAWISLIRFLW